MAMWNLTPEYIQQVKEELRGRRAAIQARHADELKSLEQDIEEIEALERMAYAVAVKHLPEAVEPSDQPKASPEVMAELEGLPAEPVAAGSERPEPETKGLSRWRMRLDAPSESESA